jgi:AhpD family alkylhydroperoxidase
MSTIKPSSNLEQNPRVKAVFDDIRAKRKADYINNLWTHIAFDADLLERTWKDVKDIMETPSTIDPLVKEFIYLGVSIANSCTYCVHSHTTAAKAKGMTMEQHGELLKIVSLAAKMNHLANGLQFPVDAIYDESKK